MAKRLTISIPDELNEKLQESKGDFKVSRICQEALKEALDRKDVGDDPKMKSLVTRIKEANIQRAKPFFDEGVSDGQQDAYDISIKGWDHYQYIKDGNELLAPKDWEIEPQDVINELDGLASERSDGKYFALSVAECESDSLEERTTAMEKFYSMVEGDLVEKGFIDREGKKRELQNEASPDYAVSFTYYDGWITGIHSVLSVAESEIRRKK